MPYIDIFRPLLSFGAHAANSATALGPDESKAAFVQLERLVGDALRQKTPANAGYFDDAWFAVAAWLDEKLLDIRNAAGAERLQRRYFNTVNAGEEFFDRLDNLLRDQAAKPEPDRADAVDVYGVCLDLGFLGRHYRPEDAPRLAEYRQRCTEICAAGRSGSAGGELFVPAGVAGKDAKTPGSMAAFWVIPVVVTVGLFILYRLILHSLYLQAVS